MVSVRYPHSASSLTLIKQATPASSDTHTGRANGPISHGDPHHQPSALACNLHLDSVMDDTDDRHIVNLPRELQVLILSRLGLRDLLVMTRVSHYMRGIIRDSPLLQYPIELAACGMHDNNQSTTSVGERLNNLRQHDQAWRTLQWSNDVQVHVPSNGRMDSKQGLILVTKESLHPERGVEVIQLPSRARNITHRRWTIEPGRTDDPFGPGQIYEVDASQDLLVIRHGMALVNTFFNIHTLSNGLPHPEAELHRFLISNTGTVGPLRSSTAGAFIRREWVHVHEERFEFYNWKTGQRSGDYSRQASLTGSVFVSHRFIATIVTGMGLSPAVLLVHELPSSDPDVTPLYPTNIPVLALFLPEVDFGVVDDTTWELLGGSVQSAAPSSRASGGDFSTDLDQTLLLIRFGVRQRDYELVVPTQRMLELLPEPDSISRTLGTLSLQDVAWSEWGPQCTHVQSCEHNDDGNERLQASIFGMRHVMHHPVEWEGKFVIRVNDYQPSRVHRTEANQTSSCTVRRAHIAEGEWPDAVHMLTELPYVETNIELPESWRGKNSASTVISINEDGVLMMNTESGEVEHGEAHTF